MDNIRQMTGTTVGGTKNSNPKTTDLDRIKAELLPEARSYVANMAKTDRATNAPMSDSQVIVLFIAGWYRERWDDLFKASYLPYLEAQPFYSAAIARRRIEETNHPLALFSGLAPAVPRIHEKDAEVDRRVAALRAVEAVRLQVAANKGRMPASIDAVDSVPVPPDPMTGKPFQYDSDGRTATLATEGPAPSRLKVVYRFASRG
jgi:hypothetical protein